MKQAQSLIILVFMSLFMSCDPVTGSLNVTQSFIFQKKKNKEITVPAGSYRTEVTASKSSLKLKLESGSFDEKLKIKLPKGTELPRTNGLIHLKAEDIDQSFDLIGEMVTEWSRSAQSSGYESCTYTTEERRCRRVCDEVKGDGDGRGRGRGNRGDCRRVCEYVTVYHSGTQVVDYHYSYENTSLKIELIDMTSNAPLGEFKGARHKSEKVYDYIGSCH